MKKGFPGRRGIFENKKMEFDSRGLFLCFRQNVNQNEEEVLKRHLNPPS